MSEKKKNIVWFGMKLTPEEKRKIELLADKKGMSQKEMILSLVEEEVLEYTVTLREGSLLDRAQSLTGVFEGPDDLSVNPKYLEGFGEKNLH
ncbi:hypothetical protein [Rhodohalobacter mucosus]|uniref:Ribbon-helix-helix protein, copG family n=1 Tax=Rhodohalobacter mucosus TaxID=2079485 RepID=A0A316TPN6_9BACT|nr:hypothetical protein [Rhodohalobacter mucosus]PWN06350.1 hypothetical protein DDZ15_11050 [Rhodohalobacter mucosus]